MFLFSKSNFVHLLANVVTVLFAFFIAVQLMLVAGILPISIAWGGRQTELTPALRVAGVAASVILGGALFTSFDIGPGFWAIHQSQNSFGSAPGLWLVSWL